VAAWALWALALAGLATVPWFEHLARQAGRPELTQLHASTIPYLLAIVVAATVGAVLASRLPRHPVDWLLLALGLSVTGSGVADGYTRDGLVARPGCSPPPLGRHTARRPPSRGWHWSASSCC
jgi:UDP-N-acetylmuramyl pentapeptide phosphotransferase/UDP-N-acetylglucosamine-1-phosphate transferase